MMFITFFDLEEHPITVNISTVESVIWGSEDDDPTWIYFTSGRSYCFAHTDQRNHQLLALIGGNDWIKFTE